MTATIRAARASDVSGVLALWREADVEPSHTDDVDSVTRLLVHDPKALIVADAAGLVVGSVIAAWDGWRGSIYRLAVAPSQRRRGLGGRLVLEAQRQLTDNGATRLQAIVVATDAQAAGFWRATGWSSRSNVFVS